MFLKPDFQSDFKQLCELKSQQSSFIYTLFEGPARNL
jgi:hypothetical protein